MGKWVFIAFCFLIIVFSYDDSGAWAREEVTIGMTENGFEPQTVSINKNDTVIFTNNDQIDRWPASNIHPTHGIYPQFDPKKPVSPGQSWSFKFDKAGEWKFHDHLFPHMRGTVAAAGEKESEGIVSRIFNLMLSIKEKILSIFSKEQPPNWENVTNHDQAHLLGERIWQKKGLAGLAICNPSFAFGCYHGFTDSALAKSLDPLTDLARGCEKIGVVGTGPWASCIHGLGHGVATYFAITDLPNALLACDGLPAGQNFCHDGVFMEFVTNAPKNFYNKNSPLSPCDTVEDKYRQGCARNLSAVLKMRFGFGDEQIANTCLAAQDATIRYYCIESIGLDVGQRSKGDANVIANQCGKISDVQFVAQCVAAAAGEIVFQNYQGWQKATADACETLPNQHKNDCLSRVSKIAKDYQRN